MNAALNGFAEAMAAFARQIEVAGRELARAFGQMMEAVMTAAGTFHAYPVASQ